MPLQKFVLLVVPLALLAGSLAVVTICAAQDETAEFERLMNEGLDSAEHGRNDDAAETLSQAVAEAERVLEHLEVEDVLRLARALKDLGQDELAGEAYGLARRMAGAIQDQIDQELGELAQDGDRGDEPPAASEFPKEVKVAKHGGIRIRKKPKATGKVVGSYPDGRVVTVIARDGDWYKVADDKWIKDKHAKDLDEPEPFNIPAFKTTLPPMNKFEADKLESLGVPQLDAQVAKNVEDIAASIGREAVTYSVWRELLESFLKQEYRYQKIVEYREYVANVASLLADNGLVPQDPDVFEELAKTEVPALYDFSEVVKSMKEEAHAQAGFSRKQKLLAMPLNRQVGSGNRGLASGDEGQPSDSDSQTGKRAELPTVRPLAGCVDGAGILPEIQFPEDLLDVQVDAVVGGAEGTGADKTERGIAGTEIFRRRLQADEERLMEHGAILLDVICLDKSVRWWKPLSDNYYASKAMADSVGAYVDEIVPLLEAKADHIVQPKDVRKLLKTIMADASKVMVIERLQSLMAWRELQKKDTEKEKLFPELYGSIDQLRLRVEHSLGGVQESWLRSKKALARLEAGS